MRAAHVLLAATAAAVISGLPPARVAASEEAGSTIEAVLRPLKPLRVGRRGLTGGFMAVLTNRSAKPLQIFHEEANSLVFESVADRSLRVVFHSCACLRNRLLKGKAFASTIPAGGKRSVRLDDWGCTSDWIPPPPGAYDVTYRVFVGAPPSVSAGDEAISPAACKARLESAAFWKRAASSAPTRVVLKGGAPSRPRRSSAAGPRPAKAR